MSQENEVTQTEQKQPFGELIRDARKRENLSIKDLASRLNLSPSLIEDLESERFSDLPPPMFVRGYIRAVSQHLKLDTDALIDVYNTHGFTDPSLMKSTLPNGSKNNRVNFTPVLKLIKWLLVLSAVSALCWFGFTKWTSLQKGAANTDALPLNDTSQTLSVDQPSLVVDTSLNNSSDQAPQVMSNETSAPTTAVPDSVVNERSATPNENLVLPVSPSSSQVALSEASDSTSTADEDAPAESETEEPTPPSATNTPQGVWLKANRDAWIKVTDSRGRVLLSRVLKRNQERTLEGVPPYRLSIGNANQVQVEYNGQAFDHTPYISANNVARLTLK